MKTNIDLSIHFGIQSAPKLKSAVVVIDVLRAFTTAAYAFKAGASKIILVVSKEDAFELRRTYPDYLLVGEENGGIIRGFDYGNSPAKMNSLNLTQKTIVLRSSSGTQGVNQAKQATKLLLGSAVNATSTANYLKHQPKVDLLAMGPGFSNNPGKGGDEDLVCAEYIKQLLILRKPATERFKESVRKRIFESEAGRMARSKAFPWISNNDLECALDIDCFNFAMPVKVENGLLIARASPCK